MGNADLDNSLSALKRQRAPAEPGQLVKATPGRHYTNERYSAGDGNFSKLQKKS
jgi:hypothetical protein